MNRWRLLPGLLALVFASAASSEASEGAAVFQRWCVHCHGDQAAAPGRLRLTWTRGEAFARLEHRQDLDAATITRVVRLGQLEMPAFRKTELGDTELAALIAYLTHRAPP